MLCNHLRQTAEKKAVKLVRAQRGCVRTITTKPSKYHICVFRGGGTHFLHTFSQMTFDPRIPCVYGVSVRGVLHTRYVIKYANVFGVPGDNNIGGGYSIFVHGRSHKTIVQKPVAPVAYQVILGPGIGQFREFEPRRVHTRINSLGLFLVHKLTCGKRESVS